MQVKRLTTEYVFPLLVMQHKTSALLQGGRTPLQVAAANGHTKVVEQLLAAGAAVDATNKVRLPPRVADTCAQVHVVVIIKCTGVWAALGGVFDRGGACRCCHQLPLEGGGAHAGQLVCAHAWLTCCTLALTD
jgi:ankyrin repeat protein